MAIEKIPLSLVATSPLNPRKTFDEDSLQELAVSIEKIGQLQAVLVRPIEYKDYLVDGVVVTTPAKYEVVCGERRYRAIKILEAKDPQQFNTIDCNVRDMNDDEAFDAMITENLQRKDVDPIEEAYAFGQLAKKGKSTEEIAARFGKSTRFVIDRIKLNNLIPELLIGIREDKLSLTLAMQLSKLNEADQHRYYNSQSNYTLYTKASVENFLCILFSRLEKAPWNTSESDGDADYAGSCGVKCSECQYNTANFNCLFSELKETSDAQCTNREKYEGKQMQFIIDMLDKHDSEFVRKGEPYTAGTAVLLLRDPEKYYYTPELKKQSEQLFKIIKERGYEYLEDADIFAGKCFDDKHISEKLANNEVYPVYVLTDLRCLTFERIYYNVKKQSKNVNCDETGTPMNVRRLLDEIKNEQTISLKSSLEYAGGEAIVANAVLDNSELDDIELEVALLLMLHNSRKYQRELKLSDWNNEKEIQKYVHEHHEDKQRIIREWVRCQIEQGGNSTRYAIRDYIETLGNKWCPEAFTESQNKAKKKSDRNVAKIVKKLADLGFTPDGRKIATKRKLEGKSEKSEEAPAKESAKISLWTRHERMRAKEPDALLLFRVGERYKALGHDASTLGVLFGLKVETYRENGHEMDMTWFEASNIEAYLPKIIRCGYRVALCDTEEE